MHKITEGNLRSAFAGESQAHIRYQIFADTAQRQGLRNTANLFKAISHAELIHASSHYRVLAKAKGDFLVAAMAPFGLGGTSDNLQTCISGETFEIEEMYPTYKATAEMQGETGAARSFTWALEVEKTHLALYQKAKQAVDEKKDTDISQVWICETCGHTVEGEPPDVCPICGSTKDKYRLFKPE